MTPRQESSIERSIGRMEGQLEGIVATLKRVDERSSQRDEVLSDLLDRIEAMETHSKQMSAVADAFAALQQAIRDGQMQAKGVLIGVSLAAGAGGATVATGFKWLYGLIVGAA